MSDKVPFQKDERLRNRLKPKKLSYYRDSVNTGSSPFSNKKKKRLNRLSIHSKNKAKQKKSTLDSKPLLNKKRMRSIEKAYCSSKRDRELLDMDWIRREVSPPLSLKSSNEAGNDLPHSNEDSNHYSFNGRNRLKKEDDFSNPRPQKESGYLLRKRLPHQLTQTIDGVICCHSCNEIESVNYFLICSKEECRESYCFKCIQQNNLLDEPKKSVNINKETWVCFKCQSKCKCAKCRPDLQIKPPQVRETPMIMPTYSLNHKRSLMTLNKSVSNSQSYCKGLKRANHDVIRIQMDKQKSNTAKPPLNLKRTKMKRVELSPNCYIFELPLSNPIQPHSSKVITAKDQAYQTFSTKQSLTITDNIQKNKDYCEQYYCLKSIKINKEKIKKSCAICFHSSFNPTELVRFKAIEEFLQYIFYCYNALGGLLCYNKGLFTKNAIRFNEFFSNKNIQHLHYLPFVKSMAICKMCIIKSVNSDNSLEYLLERLEFRNKRDKEKIVFQKKNELLLKQKGLTSKPEESDLTYSSKDISLLQLTCTQSGVQNSNEKKPKEIEALNAKPSAFFTTTSFTHNAEQKKTIEKPIKPSNIFSIKKENSSDPLFLLNPLSGNPKQNNQSSFNQTDLSSIPKPNSPLNNFPMSPITFKADPSSLQDNHQPISPDKSISNLLFSPHLPLQFQSFPSTPFSLQNSQLNYPFSQDISLSFQQIINSLNTVITHLLEMISLFVKKNTQQYFTTYIPLIEESIGRQLRKAYDTFRQLFLFLGKQRSFLNEIKMNIRKLSLNANKDEEMKEIERELNEEYANYEMNYCQYESVVNVYFSKFNMTCECIKEQRNLIDKYNNINLLNVNKTH